MFQGSTSKVSEAVVASATTIIARTDFLKISGSTQIETITPNFGGGYSGLIFVTPTDGNVVLGTSGNILVGATLIQNRLYALIYSKVSAKWFIHGVV